MGIVAVPATLDSGWSVGLTKAFMDDIPWEIIVDSSATTGLLQAKPSFTSGLNINLSLIFI